MSIIPEDKVEQEEEIKRKTEAYLEAGNTIDKVSNGATGRPLKNGIPQGHIAE